MERLTPLQVWNAMLDAPSQDVRTDLAFRAIRDGVFDDETATLALQVTMAVAEATDRMHAAWSADNMRMRLESLR